MKVTNPSDEQIPYLRNLWKEAFGDTDEFLDLFFTFAFSSDRALCIEEKGEVLASLYIFDCIFENKKIAYIYAVATKKSARGQGLCRLLMKSAHKYLKDRDYAGAILVPGSKELFGLYEKFGYKTCCFTEEFEVDALNNALEIRKIKREEFAALRRKLLPEKAVVQEGENLDFLDSFADFFAGNGFLMACYGDGDTLIVTEFFGNKEKSPYIVGALGYKKGKFRTKGNNRPFGMYLDFSDGSHNSPQYFGLAFD